MKILIVGNGGREHAIAWKLYNEGYKDLYCTPGNGGIANIAKCFAIKVNEFGKIKDLCLEKGIEFVIIGPDNPLADGIVDYLEQYGIKVFGPKKDAAMLESSKVFAKELMKKYGIPTARYEVFYDYDSATEYLKKNNVYPLVIKADGLALGKGVTIANNYDEAQNAINSIMNKRIFGIAGDKIVIEEFLEGQEISVFAVSDGKNIAPLTVARDYKRVFDGDKGPNTGGMGAFSPSKLVDKKLFDDIMENIMLKTVFAMKKEGKPFKGVLYGGLMLTQNGPMVLEFNSRFGDPEAQVILPLMQSELLEILYKAVDGHVGLLSTRFSDESSLCVVLASNGYPDNYKTGFEISGLENVSSDCVVFHANTKYENGKILTSGGRVLNVCSVGKDLRTAKQKVYDEINKIKFENKYYRKDIGDKEIY